jgi:hypothetical protein
MKVQGRVATRDESFEEALPTSVVGGIKKVMTSEISTNELLGQILNELKIMNLHLQAMTDEEFSNDN